MQPLEFTEEYRLLLRNADPGDGADVTPAEVLVAVSDARQAADWYSRMADASNALYDKAGQCVFEASLRGQPHPCSVNPVVMAATELRCCSEHDVVLSDQWLKTWTEDYVRLRVKTCRHIECTAGYCLRERKKKVPVAPELAAPSKGKAAPKPKAPEPEVEQYCRFEESLATRDYPVEGGPFWVHITRSLLCGLRQG